MRRDLGEEQTPNQSYVEVYDHKRNSDEVDRKVNCHSHHLYSDSVAEDVDELHSLPVYHESQDVDAVEDPK